MCAMQNGAKCTRGAREKVEKINVMTTYFQKTAFFRGSAILNWDPAFGFWPKSGVYAHPVCVCIYLRYYASNLQLP